MRTKTDEYIRARYKPTYCFMVSEVHDKSRDYRHRFMVSEEWKIWTLFDKELMQGFHCIILDLKDLPSRGIMTFNN